MAGGGGASLRDNHHALGAKWNHSFRAGEEAQSALVQPSKSARGAGKVLVIQRRKSQTGIYQRDNLVAYKTRWADVTAIMDDDGDVLLTTSIEARPVLTTHELREFYGAVMALSSEMQNKKAKD